MRVRTVIPSVLCCEFCLWRGRIGRKEKAAVDATTAWLALVNSGQYGESWFQAASVFRNLVSKEQWRNTMRFGASSSW